MTNDFQDIDSLFHRITGFSFGVAVTLAGAMLSGAMILGCEPPKPIIVNAPAPTSQAEAQPRYVVCAMSIEGSHMGYGENAQAAIAKWLKENPTLELVSIIGGGGDIVIVAKPTK